MNLDPFEECSNICRLLKLVEPALHFESRMLVRRDQAGQPLLCLLVLRLVCQVDPFVRIDFVQIIDDDENDNRAFVFSWSGICADYQDQQTGEDGAERLHVGYSFWRLLFLEDS